MGAMAKAWRAAMALAFISGLAGPVRAQSSQLTPAGRPDYDLAANWLCRPDLKDNRCRVDLDATVIAPSGAMSLEKYAPAKAPKIDCFFVYPTVSKDPGWQSDLTPDAMEWDDVKLQFARFGQVCRQFAPMYRQGTLTALRAATTGVAPTGPRPAPGVGGFNDVVDAWNWYLAHENKGRGVVLIGHSQGAGMVERLIAQEIEGKPVQKRLVSAIILGAAVMVPPGQVVGGTFKTIPLCRADNQLGCVITYASFRDRVPPPPSSRFGHARDGLVAGCTNPANLKDSRAEGTPAPYFLTHGYLNGSGGNAQADWIHPARPIHTPFVKTPGMLTTRCVQNGDFSYLAVHVNPNPHGHRTDELGGQVIRTTGVDASWGLHLLDVDHSMGTLIKIVGKQAQAYAQRR